MKKKLNDKTAVVGKKSQDKTIEAYNKLPVIKAPEVKEQDSVSIYLASFDKPAEKPEKTADQIEME